MTTAHGGEVRGAATAMQLGLLYESSLASKPWVNLEQIVVDLAPGAVTLPALKSAWGAVARRHDALRSVFRPAADGAVLIETHLTPDFGFETLDFSVMATPEQDQALARLIEQDRLKGADPLGFPNWRVTCIDRGPLGLTMVWTIHHALVDGTAMQIVLQDLSDHLADRSPAPVATVGLAGLADRLAAQDKTEAQAFFRSQLADLPSTGSFLIPSGVSTGRTLRYQRSLTRPMSEALRTNAAKLGGTPLNVVQAAWALLLARWTGQSRAVFGLVEAGRAVVPGFERTVGSLITTLPMHVELLGQGSIGALVADLRRATLDVRQHSHADLGDIRRWTGRPGNLPLFDTIVMYSRGSLATRFAEGDTTGLLMNLRLFEEGSAAATLAVYDDPELLIELEFDPSRLPQDRAEVILSHVESLLQSMATAKPDAALGDIAMLSPPEVERLLDLSRPAVLAQPETPCLATRFEAVARETPDAVALEDASTGERQSYGALDGLANGLAHDLVGAGVRAGDIVALHLPRGPDFVIAILAALKVRAAFLPLDPVQPKAFLESLILRSGAKAVITTGTTALQVDGIVRVVPARHVRPLPPPRPSPDAGLVAYVIFTSGSTGVPKGVLGLSGALSAHATAVEHAFELTAQDRVLAFAGLGFDVMLEEIIPTLLVGACVVLRDEAAQSSVTAFVDLVDRHAITVLNLPASFWHVLVEDLVVREAKLPQTVRLLITGSERINPNTLAQWQGLQSGVRLLNGYGPTEATITATCFDLAPDAPLMPVHQEVPIGRPLGHARACLCAFDGSLAPFGAEATLWIGGQAVTGGYLGVSAADQAAFADDRLVAGGRVYNTGDLAQWRADGQLLFHGRRDRQIKLRGHRIDLHQIENVLASLPDVRQAHVAIEAEAGVASRLLAWLVCHEGPSGADLAQIRREAARHLPRYMLPTLIAVGRLPVGPNGKINTHDLPRPIRSDLADDAINPGAKDALTSTIAQCMAKVLGTDFLPNDANFFDNGGESLLALRLVSLIEARTGKTCRASDLHQHPTPTDLARMLRDGAQGPRFIIPVQPQGTQPVLFAVHVIGNGGELFRPLANALGPDYPVFGLTVGIPKNLGEIDVQRTARVYFDEVQRHHPTGPLALCAVSMAAYFAFELAQLLREAGREVCVLAVLDAMGPDGRPAVKGLAKLRAHLTQFRRKGLSHLATIRRHRLDQWRDMRDKRRSNADEVTGYNLIAANVRAVETYVPLPYDGPLTVFRAADAFWDSPETIADGLGWASVARGGLQLVDLPGDHLSILFPENVAALAAHLRRLMQQG